MIPAGKALCLRCGRSGDVVWETLDPERPMIRCAWRDAQGDHGHGTILGTRVQAESDSIQLQKREKRMAASHARGSHDAKPTHLCPLCELEKPHRGHVRARYSDPSCERCQAAAARESGPNPGTQVSANLAGAVAQSRRSE